METRKITIVQTKNQTKSVIMSAATTLAELKRDLRANGIDYDGMTFFEGTSKTELKTDDSILPHDVPYKGQVTNELVFMLTNTNKKIRSGAMTRVEAYNLIKAMGLQEACIKKFGKNFTMCKTADLIALVNSSKDSAETKPKQEEVATEIQAPVAPARNDVGYVDIVARAAINKLVDILEGNNIIKYYETDDILGIFGGVAKLPSGNYKPKSASSYSDDEIDDMFSSMNIQ